VISLVQPASVTRLPQRPDPSVLSETIPLFFIGRNREGFWVARDAHGRVGGIFVLKQSALKFAIEAPSQRDALQCFCQSASNSTSRIKAIRSLLALAPQSAF
jgi:hypothetical protein